ncbi:MAG: hypothetical protein GY803_29010, partial [Chloroflexi bacterium]|nr:hypothetical protein [Chloroflexota bacterium]
MRSVRQNKQKVCRRRGADKQAQRTSRFTFHVLRFTFYASFFFAILLRAPSPAAAQTQSPTYWRYAASGRLT